MDNKIVHFPKRSNDMKRLDLQKGRLNCEVSNRWIQFPESIDRYSDVEYLTLDVMTLAANETERKLCEIIVDRQQLLAVLSNIPVHDHIEN